MFLNELFADSTALKTLYVSRKVVNFPELLNWAYRSGFKTTLAPTDYHVTICYSKTKFDWASTQPDLENLVISGGHRSMQNFQGGACVLKIESADLGDRWQQFLDLGATNKFSEYKPHITITYGDIPRGVKPFEGDIILGPEIWKPVDDNWKGEMVERITGA